MTCNCNRADCKAATNARGCCPFRVIGYREPSTLKQAADRGRSITELLARVNGSVHADQTHDGQGMAWGPFDPN